jgi:uncharacterized repeat protein (TIGR03803 family)
MRITISARYAFAMCAAVFILAGCGGSQPPVGAPGATRPASANVHRILPGSSYHVVYRFGQRDGVNPYDAGLIDVNGTLYGTTAYGGSASRGCARRRNQHCGTVYSISTNGAENVLHNFGVGSDGGDPFASLLNVNGTLYGTTEYGGANCEVVGPHWGCGTVFMITTSGSETVLHSFDASYGDGAYPVAGLTDVKGTLYGTTAYGGGAPNSGVVFKITTSGTLKDIYSFQGGSDGQRPQAGLVAMKGMLYGTTIQGGASGEGTVFVISTSGKERVLYSFQGGSDGGGPNALINVNGTLYGTSSRGGAGGDGTVFVISTSGKERVLYSFQGGSDGGGPYAVINVNGTLYGTTSWGVRVAPAARAAGRFTASACLAQSACCTASKAAPTVQPPIACST